MFLILRGRSYSRSTTDGEDGLMRRPGLGMCPVLVVGRGQRGRPARTGRRLTGLLARNREGRVAVIPQRVVQQVVANWLISSRPSLAAR
jgi:hypothetical protein